jgi:alpha-L-fucosidase
MNSRILKLYATLLIPFMVLQYMVAQLTPIALPSPAQLAWHEMEFYGLIHFTPTTYENKEWGYGDADPKIFNPTKMNVRQIVSTAKSSGMKGLVLVAKHHDGFCLWPTKTTDYNISKSPYKNGKGDLVREFSSVCKAMDLKFGVYCSPWDRNNPHYGKPEYLDIYREQLRELYTQYGELFISWHDGANGGDGYYGGAREQRKIDNSTYYDWDNTWQTITRKLQPNAVIFSDVGLDVRWVGNEKGYAGDPCYATFDPESIDGIHLPAPGLMNDKQNPIGTKNGTRWIPAECDVPLRKGWFYHPEQDTTVKSVDQLWDIYLHSVGRGACLNIGLAPMPDGTLHPRDVSALKALGKRIYFTFLGNRAQSASIYNRHKFDCNPIIDRDRYTGTVGLSGEQEFTIKWKKKQKFSVIRIRENIKEGQKVESFEVYDMSNGNKTLIARGSTIGANRIIDLGKTIESDQLYFICKGMRIYDKENPTNLKDILTPRISDVGVFKRY